MAATLTVLICLAALFSYVNHRWLGFPTTIGLMAVSLVFSLALIGLGKAGFAVETKAEHFIQSIDFNEAVLHGMLGLFLFAGALQVKLDELLDLKWVVASFAFVGTMVSAALIGLMAYVAFTWLGLGLSFLHCLILAR
jgi:CPA1 family monovalent cation:H+ antiporter